MSPKTKKFALKKLDHLKFIIAEPDIIMSHDNSSAIAKTFVEIGVSKVWNPDKIVIILDHVVPAASEKHAQNHKTVREFVAAQGIKNFYDIQPALNYGYANQCRLVSDNS